MNLNQQYLRLLDSFDIACAPSTQQQIDHTFERVLEKTGLPPRGNAVPAVKIRPRTWLVVAAVLLTLLLLAARYLSVSDLFSKYLWEQGSSGERAELSSMAPVVDKSGVLVSQRDRVGNLELSLQGILGDGDHHKIYLTARDITGAPLIPQRDDGVIRTRNVSLSRVEVFGPDGRRIGMGGTDSVDISGDQATILAVFQLFQKTQGEVRISVQNLRQQQYLPQPGHPVGSDALTGILEEFDGSGAQVERYTETIETDAEAGGEGFAIELERHRISNDSGRAVPLGQNTGVSITNAAVAEGSLCLRGYAPATLAPEQLTGLISLRWEQEQGIHVELGQAKPGQFLNLAGLYDPARNTVELLDCVLAFEEPDPQGNYLWTMELYGAEAFPDAAFFTGKRLLAGYLRQNITLVEGEWCFQAQLPPGDVLAEEYLIDRPMEYAEITLHLEKVILTPYRVEIRCGRQGGDNLVERDGVEPMTTLALHMTDGTVVQPDPPGYVYIDGEAGELSRLDLSYDLDVVIDPSRVQAFTLGEYTYVIPRDAG